MTTVNVKFDDYDLDHISEWEENFDSRIKEASVPRRHGSYHEDSIVFTSRKINLRGTIFAASWGDVRTELDNMKQRLSLGKRKLYFDDERYIWATLANFNHSHAALRGQGKAADFAISFICKDPFFYTNSASQSINTAISSSDTFVITNNGNISTPPTFTVTVSAGGGATNLKITNTHSDINQYIQYGSNLTTANTLIINHDAATMEKDSVNVLNDFTGDFWHLAPGDNTLLITYAGNPSVNITVDYNNRYS